MKNVYLFLVINVLIGCTRTIIRKPTDQAICQHLAHNSALIVIGAQLDPRLHRLGPKRTTSSLSPDCADPSSRLIEQELTDGCAWFLSWYHENGFDTEKSRIIGRAKFSDSDFEVVYRVQPDGTCTILRLTLCDDRLTCESPYVRRLRRSIDVVPGDDPFD